MKNMSSEINMGESCFNLLQQLHTELIDCDFSLTYAQNWANSWAGKLNDNSSSEALSSFREMTQQLALGRSNISTISSQYNSWLGFIGWKHDTDNLTDADFQLLKQFCVSSSESINSHVDTFNNLGGNSEKFIDAYTKQQTVMTEHANCAHGWDIYKCHTPHKDICDKCLESPILRQVYAKAICTSCTKSLCIQHLLELTSSQGVD